MSVDDHDSEATFLSGGGATGALIRKLDWAATPLGAPDSWPIALKTVVSVMIEAVQPMFVAWGPERTMIYNDDYAELLQDRHPAALGRPFEEVWHDILAEVGSIMDRAYAGEPSRMDDILLPIVRGGRPQETHFAYSFTPVRDEAGRVAGVFCACIETTERVLAGRRTAFMLELEQRLRGLVSAEEITAAAAEDVGLALKVSKVGYAEIDPSGEYADTFSGWSDGTPPSLEHGRFRVEDFGRHVAELRAGIPVIIDDVTTDRRTSTPEQLALHDALAVRALVVFPLMKGGRLAAWLYVLSARPRQWRSDEVALIAEVAERTRSAMERARAEAAQEESERRLIALVRHAPIGIILAEAPSGRVLLANQKIHQILGEPERLPRSVAEYGVIEAIHPETGERYAPDTIPLARALLAGETVVGEEVSFHRRDGELGTLTINATPIRNAEGRVIAAVATAEDVTGRRATEAALRRLNDTLESEVERRSEALAAADAARREADAFYRAYFENAGEVLFVVRVMEDGRFTIEQSNPTHETVTGISLAKVRGLPLEAQFSPAVAETMSPPFQRAIETRQVQRYRETYDFGVGPHHWDTTLVPLVGPDGKITHLVGTARDVTTQVMAEEALRQAQKMEAVGQLTGGIAHDFNNLLGAVIGSLDIIQKKADDRDRVRQFSSVGLEAANRGVKLTRQLLAFSRAQQLELKPLSIDEVINGMREMLLRTLGPLICVTIDLDCEGAAVRSDATQLEMAVLNLAINARDAMPTHGDLTITTRRLRIAEDPELAPGEYIELSVQDSGSGMPPEVAARAFDPFFTTKGPGKGTGLGLSQVYGIARQSGGTARIESRKGAGTTVRLFLPVTAARAVATPETANGAATAAASSSAILVVEDDPAVRRVLTTSLGSIGYKVVEACDGPTGLACLDQEAPDLMLVDFAMPGMNGAEVARAARARRPDMPIVFATGYADVEAIEEAVGADAIVLHKPFRIEDLQAALAEALATARH